MYEQIANNEIEDISNETENENSDNEDEKEPDEENVTVETVLPDSGTDTNIQNEDIIEINLFDGTDDING